MNISSFKFLCPYQVAWINETAPVAGAEKSRRIGWTYADALARVIERAGQNPVAFDHWHSSADMTAAEEYIGYCAEFAGMIDAVGRVMDGVEDVLDEETGQTAKVNTMKIVFPNGRKITAGSSNPKFFRSKGGSVGLDEFAFHQQGRELYKAAHATARFWGFPLRFWSTHNGPGSYFNGLITQARSGKLKAKIHRVTVLDAVEQGIVERIRMRRDRLKEIPVPDAKARQEWLDGLRSECPDADVWNEEYLCIPSSDNSAYLSYELIDSAIAENLTLAGSARELGEDEELYAGYDVGRRHDLSVLWVLRKIADMYFTRMLLVLDRQSFSRQAALIDAVMGRRSVRRMCIDETGLGMQLAEQAKERWGSRIEGVTLSAPVKASLGAALKDTFADRRIRIPGYVDWEGPSSNERFAREHPGVALRKRSDDWLREDLHKTRKIVTEAGNVRLAADSDAGGHADGFWAGALARHAANEVEAPLPAPEMFKPVGW